MENHNFGAGLMIVQEHVHTAQDFLAAADRELAAGEVLQGSEKLWGAASHAIMAVAQQRDWPFGSHRMLKLAADRLAEENDDPALRSGFLAAQQFHANFYHDFMEHDDLERARPVVHDFVARVLDLMA